MSDATHTLPPDIKFSIARQPKLSDWECHMTPGAAYGTILRVTEGNVPNAFHRFMQRVCFGFRWQKRGSN